MFSERTAVARHPNPLSEALERARADGRPVLDLTVSNPTRTGLPYPESEILTALGSRAALLYTPTPFGLPEARAAVARTYADLGVTVDPSRVVLSASTSEAYGFLFKLLCDDGDEVLVPAPSYPLFDLLARLEGVKLVPYPLSYDGAWHIDLAAVRAARGPRTRAVLLVSPNNPTGSYLKEAELESLAGLGLPLVCDEVFATFPLAPDRAPRKDPGGRRVPSVLAGPTAELVFALNGLSKMAALPQLKLAWLVVGGTNDAKVDEALARLELIADAFLSTGTPVQIAAAALLASRHATANAVCARLSSNLAFVRHAVAETAVTALDVEGGWYVTLRLPSTESEEAWVLRFLDRDDVYVHPGHFFDFADEAYVVVSLLTPEATLREGVTRLVARVAAALEPRRESSTES